MYVNCYLRFKYIIYYEQESNIKTYRDALNTWKQYKFTKTSGCTHQSMPTCCLIVLITDDSYPWVASSIFAPDLHLPIICMYHM